MCFKFESKQNAQYHYNRACKNIPLNNRVTFKMMYANVNFLDTYFQRGTRNLNHNGTELSHQITSLHLK